MDPKKLISQLYTFMNRDMKFPRIWYVRPAKPQISLRSDQSLCQSLEYYMTVKLLTEHKLHHFEFLSLKAGCTGLSESTLVKMIHCWKSHVTAHMCLMAFARNHGEDQRSQTCNLINRYFMDFKRNVFLFRFQILF